MRPGAWLKKRAKAAALRRGLRVTLRMPDRSPGPNPQISPPMAIGSLLVRADAAAGATQIVVGASSLAGRFIVGDLLTINGHTYSVEAEAIIAANQATVAISPALEEAVETNDEVRPWWARDFIVRASRLDEVARAKADTSERDVTTLLYLPADGLPRAPQPGDVIITESRRLTITSVDPESVGDVTVNYVVRVA